jgi:hypothetical protein
MKTLCKLYSVVSRKLQSEIQKDNSKGFDREIDFYLLKDEQRIFVRSKTYG